MAIGICIRAFFRALTTQTVATSPYRFNSEAWRVWKIAGFATRVGD